MYNQFWCGRKMKVKLALGAIAMIALISGACTDVARNKDLNSIQTVSGLVIMVEARAITEIKLVRIIDEEGITWNFTTIRPLDFTPSHLREHMVRGDPVTVTFRKVDDLLVAERLED